MIQSKGFYNYAWNPITGCKNGCPYCYAKKIFDKTRNSFDPTLYEDRLTEPSEMKEPAIIFAGCYADIFGEWVPGEWIQKVIDNLTPRHTFIFITKNPKRYSDFTFPGNVYLGVTVESPKQMWRAEELRGLPYRKLASIEPILGDFTGVDLSVFDWVVAGKMIYQRVPKQDRWLKTIKHDNLYIIKR